MGLFGIKITCGQCDKRVKASKSVFRRGLRFCDQACVDRFVAEHPVIPAAGNDPARHRLDAGNRLIAALGELHSIGASGSRSTLGYRFGSTTLEVQLPDLGIEGADDAVERSRAALYRVDALVLESLPFFYALALPQAALQLELIDLDPIRDGLMSTAADLEPVTDTIDQLLVELADR